MFVLSSLQLHNAANANQKEKYEADLKKEIKKLQVNSSNTENKSFTKSLHVDVVLILKYSPQTRPETF